VMSNHVLSRRCPIKGLHIPHPREIAQPEFVALVTACPAGGVSPR